MERNNLLIKEEILIQNYKFIRIKDILNDNNKQLLLKDVNFEIENNWCRTVPPYQTYPDLHTKYFFQLNHWQILYNAILNNIGDSLKLHSCWANLSKEDNKYDFHKHTTEKTCVYYLQNKHPEYGTKLINNVIIEGIENSVLIFDGKIPHSITNMPLELAKKYNRYSVVFDFI